MSVMVSSWCFVEILSVDTCVLIINIFIQSFNDDYLHFFFEGFRYLIANNEQWI